MCDFDDYDCCHDDCLDCEDCFEEGYEMGLHDRRRSASRSGTDGCYIATAVYGSYDCPEVWVLRRFRDYGLRQTAIGRVLVRLYYAVSPQLVRMFGHAETVKRLTRSRLDMLVGFLKKKGFADTAYYDR